MPWIKAVSAILNIAILTEDQSLFQSALSEVRYLIKAAIFLQTDQQLLRDLSCPPSSSIEGRWYYPQKYLSGLTQETCRELAHTAYGLAAIFNIASKRLARQLNTRHSLVILFMSFKYCFFKNSPKRR